MELNPKRISLKNLYLEYENQRTLQRISAVENINFEIDAGQFIVVVGPSGCGKTSILNAIAGLLTPVSGEVLIDEAKVIGPHIKSAMVFQTPALMPWRTVLKNTMYGLELQGISQVDAKARAKKYLKMVGMDGFSLNYPHQLSGGMQQRINLARALSVNSDILLFDEPLSALDSQARAKLQEEIQQIVLQTGTTAVYVTHDVREAIILADKIIVMGGFPGAVQEIIPVELPRIRTHDILWDSLFLDIEQHILSILHGDIEHTSSIWNADLGKR